jgi:hypothetical protein
MPLRTSFKRYLLCLLSPQSLLEGYRQSSVPAQSE